MSSPVLAAAWIAALSSCADPPRGSGDAEASPPDPDTPISRSGGALLGTPGPAAGDVPLVLTDLDPQMGPPRGGDLVTFKGGGLASGVTARLGGEELASLDLTGGTQLRAQAPRGSGFADATIHVEAQSAKLPLAYYHGSWIPAGPSGGQVTDVVAAGAAYVYASTQGGIYRSTNGGADWELASAGLGHKLVHDLAVDPTNPERVFAAILGGVYVTHSAGQWWSEVGQTPNGLVQHVTVAASDPSVVYACAYSQVFRSTDGGESWTEVLSGVSDVEVTISPEDASTVFAASTSGLRRSTDGGTTWSPAGDGPAGVTSLAIDPSNPARMYAVAGSGVYKSIDGGSTWAPTGFSLPQPFPTRVIAIDPVTTSTLYVGTYDARVFTSADEGITWTEISSGIVHDEGAPVMGISVRPSNPAELHVAVATWGIYRSTTGGASWIKSDRGIHAARVAFLAPHPTTAGTVFAGAVGQSLWKSTDHGATWTHAAAGLPTGRSVDAVAFHPTQPDLMLAGTDLGVYRSTDGGQTWSASNVGMSFFRVRALLFDPDDPARVYAAGIEGVYRSLDTGATWQRVVTAMFFDSIVKRGNTLIATNGFPHRSTDNGATWSMWGSGLPSSGFGRLVADPIQPNVVYGLVPATPSTVYRSLDAGLTWSVMAVPGVNLNGFAIDPNRSETIYLAAFDGSSVHRSLTGFATRVPFSTGLPPHAGRIIAVDRTGTSVYLGTGEEGIYRLGN